MKKEIYKQIDEYGIMYRDGDATDISTHGSRETVVIPHIVNNLGSWGAGFVVALSEKWDAPEESYRSIFENDLPFELGHIQPVQVEEEPNVWVVNMFAQDGVGYSENGSPPISYVALTECLRATMLFISGFHPAHVTVQMPRIGCGLAGGTWDVVSQLIGKSGLTKVSHVVVCDL